MGSRIPDTTETTCSLSLLTWNAPAAFSKSKIMQAEQASELSRTEKFGMLMLAKFKSYLIRKYYGGFVDVCGNARVMNGNGLYMPGFSFVTGWEALKDSAQKYLLFAFICWALNIYRKHGGSSGQTGVKETTERIQVAGACSRNVRDLLMKVASSMKPEHADSR